MWAVGNNSHFAGERGVLTKCSQCSTSDVDFAIVSDLVGKLFLCCSMVNMQQDGQKIKCAVELVPSAISFAEIKPVRMFHN